jgi:hypothetical protein
MDIAAFANLFESYCDNYKYQDVPGGPVRGLHFLHYDMEEMTNALPVLKLPAFFLTTPEVDKGGSNNDGLIENYEASFMVLLQLPGKDITKKAIILDKAKKIADQFVRRMMYDSGSGIEVLEGFNAPGIKEGPVNRTADYLYGWTVSFNLEQGFDGEIQPDVWKDLAP